MIDDREKEIESILKLISSNGFKEGNDANCYSDGRDLIKIYEDRVVFIHFSHIIVIPINYYAVLGLFEEFGILMPNP